MQKKIWAFLDFEISDFWGLRGVKIRKFRKGPPLQKSQKFPIFEKFYAQYRRVYPNIDTFCP